MPYSASLAMAVFTALTFPFNSALSESVNSPLAAIPISTALISSTASLVPSGASFSNFPKIAEAFTSASRACFVSL